MVKKSRKDEVRDKGQSVEEREEFWSTFAGLDVKGGMPRNAGGPWT